MAYVVYFRIEVMLYILPQLCQRLFVRNGLVARQVEEIEQEEDHESCQEIGDDDHADVQARDPFDRSDDIDLQERKVQQQQERENAANRDQVERHRFGTFPVAIEADETGEDDMLVVQLNGVQEKFVGIPFDLYIVDIQYAESIGLLQQGVHIYLIIHRKITGIKQYGTLVAAIPGARIVAGRVAAGIYDQYIVGENILVSRYDGLEEGVHFDSQALLAWAAGQEIGDLPVFQRIVLIENDLLKTEAGIVGWPGPFRMRAVTPSVIPEII